MTLSTSASSNSPFRSAAERVSERETKRDAVLRAAVVAFNESGFHAASLEDVALALGVSKPTIYHYLGNKDQVLLECVSRGLAQLEDAVERAAAAPGSGIDRLRAFLQRYGEEMMNDFGQCVVRTGDEFLSPDSAARFRELKRRIDTKMRGLIEAGIADGTIAPLDVRLAAYTMAGALNWSGRWYKPDGVDQPETVARVMVAMLTEGITPR